MNEFKSRTRFRRSGFFTNRNMVQWLREIQGVEDYFYDWTIPKSFECTAMTRMIPKHSSIIDESIRESITLVDNF